MTRKLDASWLQFVDAVDASAQAQRMAHKDATAMQNGLEILRSVLHDEDVRASLGGLLALDGAAFTMLESKDRFCGRKISGRA